MPATITAPALDLDAAGLLLVREVEDYLRQVAPTPASRAGLDLAVLLAQAPPPNAYGTTVQPWHAHIPEPRPTVTDRLLGRRPVAEVTVSQHLDLISRYIAQHGWTQGALWTSTGAVCVLGAQLRILQAGYSSPETVRRARIRLGNELGYQGTGMPIDTFNDLPTTRRTDIHRLLQRAAARSAD